MDKLTSRQLMVSVLMFMLGVLTNAVYSQVSIERRVSVMERVVEQVSYDRRQQVGKAEWDTFVGETREQLREIRQDLRDMKGSRRGG